MATIIQNYGPIYGEVVNGTVQGRPNGSVYVPISNVITLYNTSTKISYDAGTWKTNVGGAAAVNAQSQDLSSYIVTEIYSDSGLTTLVASRSITAGVFDYTYYSSPFANGTVEGITTGDIFYIRAQLFNNGTPIATSSVIQLEVVVS